MPLVHDVHCIMPSDSIHVLQFVGQNTHVPLTNNVPLAHKKHSTGSPPHVKQLAGHDGNVHTSLIITVRFVHAVHAIGGGGGIMMNGSCCDVVFTHVMQFGGQFGGKIGAKQRPYDNTAPVVQLVQNRPRAVVAHAVQLTGHASLDNKH